MMIWGSSICCLLSVDLHDHPIRNLSSQKKDGEPNATAKTDTLHKVPNTQGIARNTEYEWYNNTEYWYILVYRYILVVCQVHMCVCDCLVPSFLLSKRPRSRNLCQPGIQHSCRKLSASRVSDSVPQPGRQFGSVLSLPNNKQSQ